MNHNITSCRNSSYIGPSTKSIISLEDFHTRKLRVRESNRLNFTTKSLWFIVEALRVELLVLLKNTTSCHILVDMISKYRGHGDACVLWK